MKAEKGFTLIELLIVIAIVGVLSTVVLASLNASRARARDSERISNVKQVQNALAMYHSEVGSYPVSKDLAWAGNMTDFGALDTTGATGYIPNLAPTYIKVLPVDPKQTASTGYVYKSNGIDYSFVAHGTAEGTVPNTLKIPSDTEGKDIAVSTTGFAEGPFAVPGYVPVTKVVSGNITYANGGSSQMHNVTVYLKQGGSTMYSTTTPATGNGDYSFPEVAPGTYDVYFSLPTAVSGINSTDAGAINYWITHPGGVGGITLLAADVYNNSSSVIIDINDATSIQHRFVFGPWDGTPPPNFVFTKSENETTSYGSFPIQYAGASGSPASSTIKITVGASNLVQNFKSLAYGDFNASYNPL